MRVTQVNKGTFFLFRAFIGALSLAITIIIALVIVIIVIIIIIITIIRVFVWNIAGLWRIGVTFGSTVINDVVLL